MKSPLGNEWNICWWVSRNPKIMTQWKLGPIFSSKSNVKANTITTAYFAIVCPCLFCSFFFLDGFDTLPSRKEKFKEWFFDQALDPIVAAIKWRAALGHHHSGRHGQTEYPNELIVGDRWRRMDGPHVSMIELVVSHHAAWPHPTPNASIATLIIVWESYPE